MDSIDSEDNTLWQEWIKSKLKKRAFRPIGDIWNKCDDKPDRKLIGKVIVEATRRGVHATIVGNYTIEELLKKGKLEVVVKYRDMTMFNKKLDLCKALVDLEVYCPLKKGETINFWHSVPFPKFIPKGQYTAVSTLYDVHGTCIGQAIAGFKL